MASQLTGTLSNFIIRIRRFLNSTDATKSHWTDDFLKQLFNSSYRRRCTQIQLAYEGNFTNIAARDLESGKSRYEWPEGFQRELKLSLVRNDGRKVPITRYERHYEVLDTQGSLGDGYMATWRPVSGGFVLEPGPVTDITDGLEIEYHGLPVELTADGDSLHDDFPAIFDELLVLDTAILAFHSTQLTETGIERTLEVTRKEWEWDWLRYIDSRMTAPQRIAPFSGMYRDA